MIIERLSRSFSPKLRVALACVAILPASISSSAPLELEAHSLSSSPAAQVKPDPRKEYALIFGTVWGVDGKPAYGVPVKIRRAEDKKARWEVMSDHRGEFAQRVPTGTHDYVIWADVKTKKGKDKPSTKAHVDKDERVDVSLHLTE